MRLDYPDKYGVSKREHLELIAESRDELPAELEEPPIPERYAEAWDLMWEIRTGESITYQELKAYQDLSRCALSPILVDQIRYLDAVVRKEISLIERAKTKTPAKEKDRGQTHAHRRIKSPRR